MHMYIYVDTWILQLNACFFRYLCFVPRRKRWCNTSSQERKVKFPGWKTWNARCHICLNGNLWYILLKHQRMKKDEKGRLNRCFSFYFWVGRRISNFAMFDFFRNNGGRHLHNDYSRQPHKNCGRVPSLRMSPRQPEIVWTSGPVDGGGKGVPQNGPKPKECLENSQKARERQRFYFVGNNFWKRWNSENKQV